MNILLLNGNSAKQSFCKSICGAYEEGARKAGHTVQVVHIADMQFDPILHEGYHCIQPLEPDLVKLQQNILHAEHIVIIYPTWWGGLPALLKGLFDRSFNAGFSHKPHQKDPLWDKLLKGRSAHIITTMDAPKLWYWLVYRSAGTNMLKRAILYFCGIKPVKVTIIAGIKNKTRKNLVRELEKIKKRGAAGY